MLDSLLSGIAQRQHFPEVLASHSVGLREDKMTGRCDTCEQACEVFHAAGRTDLVCSDCYINVATAIQLYQMLSEIERAGGRAVELETQFELALHAMFSRIPSGARQGTD